MSRLSALALFRMLRWLDGSPLMNHIEPYRLRLFELMLNTVDESGRPRYNLGLFGRAKKNWKTADMILAGFHALLDPSPHGNQVYLVANDEQQAAQGLELVKKLITANGGLKDVLVLKEKTVARKDSRGFMAILPAQYAIGEHGKTFRFLGVDELHGQRDWDLLEALQPDPHRLDAQTWLTSYASIYHRPGVPLFDLCQQGRAGVDPRMLFSWYAADRCTDPDFADKMPEGRANPSMASWADPDYLDQQRRRLPAHKFRRLHLNLPGLPEGSAFQVEPVMDAIARGVTVRRPEPGVLYEGVADMSGGSSDEAVLVIGHKDPERRAVLDVLMNQGPPPPFDPRAAVARFAVVLREYGISTVHGDAYAGETFRQDFAKYGIGYQVLEQTRSQLYEALEPRLNAREVVLLDIPILEQQFLGLVWRGGKIDHPSGEHDDWSNAAAGVVAVLLGNEFAGLWFMRSDSPTVVHVAGPEPLPLPAELIAARAAKAEAEDRAKQGDLERRDAERLWKDGPHWTRGR